MALPDHHGLSNGIQPSIKIEAFEFDRDGRSEYRLLVNNQHTKYVSLAANVLPSGNLVNFSYSPLVGGAALPPLPPGDWNHGVITKCPLADKPVWTTALNDWPGVTGLWHNVIMDKSDFTPVMILRNNIEVITCPRYPNVSLMFKFATFPHHIPAINHETLTYKAISEGIADDAEEGKWWAPRFLGHVTFEGKVVGFLTPFHISRPPQAPLDFIKCEEALAQFHSLGRIGMTHGAIKRAHFLMIPVVCRSGELVLRAMLVDYSNAKPVEVGWEAGEEMRQLRIAFGVGTLRDYAPANMVYGWWPHDG